MTHKIISATPKMTPAPFDEKSLTTDWLDQLFDMQSCVWNKNSAVGFVDSEPQYLTIKGNRLTFSGGKASAKILERMESLLRDGECTDIVYTASGTAGGLLEMHFYFA